MSLQAAALYALVGVTGAGQSVRDLQGVSNQVNKTQGVLAGLSKSGGQIGRGLGQVAGGMVRIGEAMAIAAAGAVVGSAKVGTSFQAMTELIHTQAGASQAEVDKMRIGIQDMVHEVGTGPNELAKALYHIESVGVRGAEALDILKASAIGAKVGLADMESVTNALTAVWFSGIKGAKSMTDAMAILDGIVGVGNMHLQDLTDSFKSGILGTAATYGVDIRSLGAAIATLTDAGVPADIAATRLNNTLTHLAAPTKQAIGVLKDLGLGQFDLAKALRTPDGLFAALSTLHDALAKQGELVNGQLTPQGAADMSKLFGGSRFGATAMQLLTQMDRIQDKYKLITERSKTFGGNVAATMETAGFKFGQFKADIEESALAFSQGFLPALARAGSKLDGFLMGHRSDIIALGKDLGAWIDRIDWTAVQKGANDFLGMMKTVLDVIGKIPPQIDLIIVGFLGLNKVSGGLLGKGLENIVGGAVGVTGALGRGLLRGLLGKIPVVGGALSAATSTPVFVTNWPAGFGLPGGLPGGVPAAAGAGAAEGAAGLTLGAGLTAAAIGTAVATAMIGSLTLIYNATSTDAQKAALQGIVNEQEAYKRSGGRVDLNGSFGHPPSNAPNHVTTGGFNADYRPRVTAGGFDPGLATDVNITLGGFDRRLAGAGQALGTLSLSARLAKAGLHELGAGSVKTAFHKLMSGIQERSKAKYGHTLGPAAVQATFGRDLIHAEKRLLRSNETTNVKLAGLNRLQKIAVDGKDWGVARKLKHDIAQLKAQNKADAAKMHTAEVATKAAAQAAAFAIRDKDMSVVVNTSTTVNTSVSLRDVFTRTQTNNKMSRLQG